MYQRAGLSILIACIVLLPVVSHAQVTGVPATDAQNGNSTNLIDNTWNNTPAPTTSVSPSASFQDLRSGLPGQVIDTNEAPDMRCSAKTIIGANIRADNGDTAAQILDVVLDQNGYAQKVIFRDSGFFGFGGKSLSIDYKDVIDDSGTAPSLIRTVNKDLIKDATVYDSVVDVNHMRATLLFGADVKADNGDSMASVQNVVLSSQTEPYLILSYVHNSTPGTALIKYKDVQKVYTGQGVYIQLTKPQADFFKTALLSRK